MSELCYYVDDHGDMCRNMAEWEIAHYERAGNLETEEEILDPDDVCEFVTCTCNNHLLQMLEKNYVNVVQHMKEKVDIGTHLNGIMTAESLN